MKEGDLSIEIKTLSCGMCPDCGRYTRFAHFHMTWQGWDSTCLRCGRRWGDGEWLPLDFSRYARRDSIDSAKRRWKSGN